jgi:molybdate transport system substrate-binding protein
MKNILTHSALQRSVLALVIAAASSLAAAADLHVVSSGGFAAAYKALAPDFEKKTGHKLISGWGPSMGETPQAIPNRLKRGEAIDVVIMVGDSLDKLVAEGKVSRPSTSCWRSRASAWPSRPARPAGHLHAGRLQTHAADGPFGGLFG